MWGLSVPVADACGEIQRRGVCRVVRRDPAPVDRLVPRLNRAAVELCRDLRNSLGCEFHPRLRYCVVDTRVRQWILQCYPLFGGVSSVRRERNDGLSKKMLAYLLLKSNQKYFWGRLGHDPQKRPAYAGFFFFGCPGGDSNSQALASATTSR